MRTGPGRLVCLLLLVSALPARADVGALLGRRITSVHLDAGGVPVDDRNVLAVVETRLGDALTMSSVRHTIQHFVTLGRYADVRVFGEPDGADGVRLRYEVVPLERVTRVAFAGHPGIDSGALRSDLTDRFGAVPMASRLPEMAQAIATTYEARGYPAVRVETERTPAGRDGTLAVTFLITPGPQTVVGRVTVDGPPAATRGLAERLGLVPGRPLDAGALANRTDDAEDVLRRDRFYEALVSAQVAEAPDGGAADVAVRVDVGDRVEIAFTGDPLPADRRRSLVPIERLRSVEEEVVEDGSRNIEQYLRLEGYRAASAPASRQRQNGVLRITFAVSRGPLHVLGRVETAGVSALPRAELEPLLKLQPGEPYVDARVAAVAAALAEHYRVRGFAAVTITPQVTFPGGRDPAKVPVDVRFLVAEGARTLVTDVRIEGAAALPVGELLGALGLTAGKPFYLPQQAIDREVLERRYRNAGFQRASVEARPVLSADGSGVTVTYLVNEGPQTRVDHVLVSGAERISSELVRREVTLEPGTPLGYDAIIESQQKLSALGLFRRVRITEAPHGIDDTSRDVLIELEEAPTTTVSYGGGLEVGRRPRRNADGTATDRFDIAPRGFFEVTRRNLWGKNRSLSALTSVSLRPTDPGIDAPDAQGGYGLNQYRIVGTFREPRAFGSVGDAQLSAFVERGIRSSFNFDRQGVRAEYARRFGNRLTMLGRYSYNFTTLFDTKIAVEDQLLIDRLFPQVHLASLFGSAVRDSRPDVLDPDRGTVLGTDLELALRSLSSEVGFIKSFAQAFAYRRLPGARPFIVAAGLRVGLARGFERRVPQLDGAGQPVLDSTGTPVVDVVADLPASERFFAGGDSTVRGFALDRLGSQATLNSAGFPTGGNAMVVLNAELRTPYAKGVGLVGFVDAGNVFRRASDIDVADLRTTAGFGIRYRSPLGPLRFDIGFKLDRRDFALGSERRAVYHLSLGQAF